MRAAWLLAWVAFAFATFAPPAPAEPILRIRGEARVEVTAGWLDGHLVVNGVARDETGRPLSGAELRLRGFDPRGVPAALPPGTPCSPLAGADAVPRGTPEERSLSADRSGRFCALFAGEPTAEVEIRLVDARGLMDASLRRVPVDRSRRGVELRFPSPPTALDLDVAEHRIEVAARSEPALPGGSAPLLITLHMRASDGDRLLGQSSCRVGAAATFLLRSADLGQPGPVDLLVRFAGTPSLQPAEAHLRLPRTTRVSLALGSAPVASDPESGVELNLAVSSSRGAVGSGSVEARLGSETVGIARVENGSAQISARFSRAGADRARLFLVYLPSEPWWSPGAPLAVDVKIAPPSRWRSVAWLVGLLAIAAWLLKGWRRPARAARAETARALSPKPRAAAVVVLEVDDLHAGWRGTVRDAHDEALVREASIAVVVDEPEGPRVLVRTTSDEHGQFELPPVTASSEARFVVSARWHSTLSAVLPASGRLMVDLVTRRRQLVARFVAWAARDGSRHPGRPEPTPGEVRQQASRARRPEVADWAEAVEAAAYGPSPVDEPVERQVLEREPPERQTP